MTKGRDLSQTNRWWDRDAGATVCAQLTSLPSAGFHRRGDRPAPRGGGGGGGENQLAN